MHNSRHLVLLLPLLLGASAVQAGKNDAKERQDAPERRDANAAKKACLTGDTAKGIDILADLYLATNDPTHIYNQGRCLEQNRKYADAVGRFREFLVKATDASEAVKNEARKHIADCQSYLRTDEERTFGRATPEPYHPSTGGTGPSQPVAATAPEPPISTTPREPTGVVSVDQPSVAGKEGAGLRSMGVAAIAVGAASLIAGVALNLKANSLSSDLEKTYYDPSTDSTRKTYRTLAWIGYGAGATCIAGGAVLYYLGWHKGNPDSSMAIAPTVAPGMAGAILSGAF